MMDQMNRAEIKAELLLNHLYPEMSEQWIVEAKGTFYRNYSEDVMAIEENLQMVTLSRESFLKLLPQGLIAPDDELKGRNFEQKYEVLRKKKIQLEEFFRPRDTFSFRRALRVEKIVAQLLEEKLDFILEKYFHCKRAEESNPYIRELMVMLPYVSKLRANFGWIRDVLELLLACRVTMSFSRYDWGERIQDVQPMVRYLVWISNLNSETYKKLEQYLEPLRTFICEWFIPFDTLCLIEVKDEKAVTLDQSMILNYNTKLKL